MQRCVGRDEGQGGSELVKAAGDEGDSALERGESRAHERTQHSFCALSVSLMAHASFGNDFFLSLGVGNFGDRGKYAASSEMTLFLRRTLCLLVFSILRTIY